MRTPLALGLGLAAAIATLGACKPIVDVTHLHPTPRCIMTRAVDSVKLLPAVPENGVAVYGIVASNGQLSELQTAVHHKAAHLGCDGVVIAEYTGAGKTRGVAATGQLNEHRELAQPRLLALCVVLAKTEAAPENRDSAQ
jgi:hypothetical protein